MADEFQIKRGDDRILTITATYPEAIPEQNIAAGDPYPLHDKTVWFTGKADLSDPDENAILKKKNGEGITVRAAPNRHVADVEIDSASTAVLTEGMTLKCDVQTKSGSKIWTVWDGTIKVTLDATRATT